MKKTKKYLLILIFSFLVIAAVTVCADFFVQYRQNYAAAPYVNTDPAVTLTADELRALFAQKTGPGTYEHWMQAFCDRKYNSDFAREMSRSVREYLKQFKG